MVFAPCNWFGSSFEGACGYGALAVALLLGLSVFVIAFGLLLWYGLRRLDAASVVGTDPPALLYRTWQVLLVLLVLLALQPLLMLFPALYMLGDLIFFIGMMGGSEVTWALSLLLLVGFVVASARLALYRGRHPAVGFIALVPLLGPLAVGALLWKNRPSLAASGAV